MHYSCYVQRKRLKQNYGKASNKPLTPCAKPLTLRLSMALVFYSRKKA